jgi:hypothetical protein
MKQFSFTYSGGKYSAVPEGSSIHPDVDEGSIQEFESVEALHASQEFKDYRKLQNDGLTSNELNWIAERDRILNSAVVIYQGNYIDMSEYSQVQLAKVRESLGRRTKKAKWKVKSVETGEYLRIDLSKSDINKISDAVIDASQIVHLDADTKMPVNPWPIEVT